MTVPQRASDSKLGRETDVRKIIENLPFGYTKRLTRGNQLRHYLFLLSLHATATVERGRGVGGGGGEKEKKKKRRRKKRAGVFTSFHAGEECNQRFYTSSTCPVVGTAREFLHRGPSFCFTFEKITLYIREYLCTLCIIDVRRRFNWIINHAAYRRYRSDLELSSRRPNDPTLSRFANSRGMLRSSRTGTKNFRILYISDRSC